ncbi:ribonuclease HII [Oleidesulfovibrio alaskensis]|jgi:ribonuclease HII|uniref:ribonuclease HII n=1 Tax=Oleidesulfovibrio alaskensis TaxID=58180 RepID=UPI00235613A1|nr:ribonuclease HII [Oleidesulfovibrio alaskensis]
MAARTKNGLTASASGMQSLLPHTLPHADPAGPRDSLYPAFFTGIDEAGRGCLAGPVVAAAVILPPAGDPAAKHIAAALSGLTDSKKLSEKRRLTLEPAIKSCAVRWGVGVVWPQVIDRINILQATYRAMSLAVRHLRGGGAAASMPAGLPPVFLAVDGDKTIPGQVLQTVTGLSVPQEAIVGGDGCVMAISAASVLAKTFRDRLMTALDKRYSGYGFATHKGYGTAAHIEAIRRLGPCRMHRLSFAKVKPAAAPHAADQNTLW